MSFENFKKKYHLFSEAILEMFYSNFKGTQEEIEAMDKAHEAVAKSAQTETKEATLYEPSYKDILLNVFPSKTELNKQLIFKVINPYYLEYTNTDSAERKAEYEEHNEYYGYQIDKKYHDNFIYYSAASADFVNYQIFLSFSAVYRKKIFLESQSEIQNYFMNKFGIAFFYDKEYEMQVADFEKKWEYLHKLFTFEDFKKIISPNLKIELFEKFSLDNASAKYYLFNNWDFFTAIALQPEFTNLFYKNSATLSNKNVFASDDKIDLIKKAIVNINTAYDGGPDEICIGTLIDDEMQQKLENNTISNALVDLSGSYSTIELRKREFTYRIFSTIPHNIAMSEKYDGKDEEFMKDFAAMVKVYQNNMLPFVLLEN